MVSRHDPTKNEGKKYISAFLIVSKIDKRILISQTLENMRQIFGKQFMATSILVFNFNSKEVREKNKHLVLNTQFIKGLKS